MKHQALASAIEVGYAAPLSRDSFRQESTDLPGDRFRMRVQQPAISFRVEKRSKLRLAEPEKMRDSGPVALSAVYRPADFARLVLGKA
jgi:hypothetical protein